MHLGNDALLADIRKNWDQALIVNRPGRALQDVGSDIAAGLADLESYGEFVLSTPDYTTRLKFGAATNGPDKSTYYGGRRQRAYRLPDAGCKGGGVMHRNVKHCDRQ
jgi:N-ethylmaleimide reductase